MKLFDEITSLINHEEEPIKYGDPGIIFGTDGYGAVYVKFPQCTNLVKMSKENIQFFGTMLINYKKVNHIQFDYSTGHGFFIPLDEV